MSKNSEFLIDGKEIFSLEHDELYYTNSQELILVSHLDSSINKALKDESKLPDTMTELAVLPTSDLAVEKRLLGFSGYRFRHLLNNLCSLEEANYLEVGVFRGSTLLSAVYGNENIMGECHAIDNYSEFAENVIEHPRDSYERYLNMFLPHSRNKIQFHEIDCFKMDLTLLPKIDIYFYDGVHSAESQYKAFKYFEPVFADCFIAVVDDWEMDQVREGTRRAFEQIGYDVIASRAIIPGKPSSDTNRTTHPTPEWWNGTHLSVLKKRGN